MTWNRGFVFKERVGRVTPGTSLVDYLASRYPHSSSGDWRRRIENGSVLVDDDVAPPETALAAGRTIAWRRPPWREPRAPAVFGILHRDDHLLAVAKPAGLPTLPGAGFYENTLLRRVRAVDPDATPLHRLGRWTSGLVLFGRSPMARRELALAWRTGRVAKRYLALVSGTPRWSELQIRTPIGPVPHARIGSVFAASDHGKPAESRVRVLERRPDGFLAEVTIATGRPHQIRIHLASIGHPLIGDPLYVPGGVPRDDAVPGDGGYLLHSAELGFCHPETGCEVTLQCSPPPLLKVVRSVLVSRGPVDGKHQKKRGYLDKGPCRRIAGKRWRT